MISQISNIKTGPYELIDSGIIQILSKEVTTLIFDSTISIEFKFENNHNDIESFIKVDTTEQNTIKFILVNINMPNYGTIDFVKFGTQTDGKDLYISFRVNSLNDKTVRSLEYSIYKKNV